MSQTIRIPEADYAKAQDAAKLNQRSLSGQIVHWMNIGRTIERSPGFSMDRVEAALRAEMHYDQLTPDEQEVFMEQFHDYMRNPGPEVDEFYAKLEEEAKAVGYTGE